MNPSFSLVAVRSLDFDWSGAGIHEANVTQIAIIFRQVAGWHFSLIVRSATVNELGEVEETIKQKLMKLHKCQ